MLNDRLVLKAGGPVNNQFISNAKEFGGIYYNLEFVQVIDNELYIIYKGEPVNLETNLIPWNRKYTEEVKK